MRRAWVVIESREGRIAAAGRELLGWAAGRSADVEAVHWGEDAAAAAVAAGGSGASRVLTVGPLGGAMAGVVVAGAMARRMADEGVPDLVLFSPTHDQRDIAGRLSARLDRPVLTNCTGVTVDDAGLSTEHEAGGSVVRARSTAPAPHLVVVRPMALAAPAATGIAAAEVVALPAALVGPTGAAVVRRRVVEEPPGPALESAAVVVAGGRGVVDAAGFALVARLAGLLGGAVGATRAAVDAGWATPQQQVGRTGQTVVPDVYLAFGISGASQHVVGMAGARTVVAVDRDPAAAIFDHADLGIVGDAPDVLRRLVAAVSARQL